MYRIMLVLLALRLAASDIHISEVMSNPQGSEYENEFIEVFNTSEHVIQINGWTLSDGNGIDSLVHLAGPPALASAGFGLILDPGYPLGSGVYSGSIPDSIPLYTISTDGSFGNGGLANSGESVILRNPDSSSTSYMSWSTASANGHSWERVSLMVPDSQAVWEQSLLINGTPGYSNSVTPPRLDLALIQVVELEALPGSIIQIRATVKNTGTDSMAAYRLGAYRDDNQNGQQDAGEWSQTTPLLGPIQSSELQNTQLSLFPLAPGIQKIGLWLTAAGDEVTGNDSFQLPVVGSYPPQVLGINELMFSPDPDQGGEWVELLNLSNSAVSLQNWQLADATDHRHLITESLIYLEPDSFVILAAAPALPEYLELHGTRLLNPVGWPTLNASSDSVRLFDATGREIAQVYYCGSWGVAGRSLERRQPRVAALEAWNWGISQAEAGATPGLVNSQLLPPAALQIQRLTAVSQGLVGPAQLPLSLHFSNQGLDTLHQLQVKTGSQTSTWTGDLTSFAVDSLSLMTDVLPAGFSAVAVELYVADSLLADTSLSVLLGFPPDQLALNEIYYYPGEDQIEFLEFVNLSGSELSLQSWAFADRSGTRGTIHTAQRVPSDSLLLFCPDSVTLADWSEPSASIFQLGTWPSLNNSFDSIIIYDPTGRRQLALAYASNQGGAQGVSLERLALWRPATDPANWASCVAPAGSTPGRVNSVKIPAANLVLSAMDVQDSIILEQHDFRLRSRIFNAGQATVTGSQLICYLIKGQDTLAWQTANLPPLIPGDTLVWETRLTPLDCGWLTLGGVLRGPAIDPLVDNALTTQLWSSCPSSPIILNEIMPSPFPGESEWLELHNRSDQAVDLRGWQLADDKLVPHCISDSALVIPAGDFLLLGAQAEANLCPGTCATWFFPDFPSLNNSADALHLYDPQGISMDDLAYSSTMVPPVGRSLERIRSLAPGSDPANWSPCIATSGSTPGLVNSLDLVALPTGLTIDLSPNPFTPNGDGHEDLLFIDFELPVEQGLVSILIYDMAGRRIAEPWLARPVSHRGRLSWDGSVNYGGMAATGLYICRILVDGQQGQLKEVLKKIYLVR